MNIIILPGMGADSQMYKDSSYNKLSGVIFPDWPSYRGEQSISKVAKRVIEENNIQEIDMVGGSSLGGIVAAEIAQQVRVERLILIGSTLIPQNINPVLKKFGNVAGITPIRLFQSLAGKITSSQDTLVGMFSKSESSFIRAMSKAIFNWKGNPKPNCEVCHIHGARDKVISPPHYGAELISDGGHLIAMTHSEIVSEFIYKATN